MDDRFEAAPDGLKVTRDGRSWTVRDPRPEKRPGHGFVLCEEPIVCYTDGAKPYYFDPRFIELEP